MLRGREGAGAAPRAAVTTLLLAALSLVLGLASGARIVPGTPAIQVRAFFVADVYGVLIPLALAAACAS